MCRAANTAHVAATRARRAVRLATSKSDPAHGTQAAYDAGCRCDDCCMIRAIRYHCKERPLYIPRPHHWREAITAAYRAARTAWEERFETETHKAYAPGLITRERRAERRGGRREVTDFIERDPPITLSMFLSSYRLTI